MGERETYDVVIVGASIAGCTAAAGAVRNSVLAYTPVGKIDETIDEYGYSIRREKLPWGR